MNLSIVPCFFYFAVSDFRVGSIIMSIDPARLARIRLRVLAAAAAVAVPACGGAPHVNERHPDPPHVNEAAPDKEREVTPTNEHPVDHPPSPTPEPKSEPKSEPKHINTPAPDATLFPRAGDGQPKQAPTTADIPPPGQTINVAARDSGPPQHINVRTQEPAPSLTPEQRKKRDTSDINLSD
jgi:hypothetical protein